ncbi:MAG: sulfatase-like hydrolase/transferase [Clostridia bacterium]|nr:sulfatase-like hydrolase/transferase [Clostridia bacterium]
MKKRLISVLLTLSFLLYLEVITKIFTTGGFTLKFIYTVLFMIPLAFILTLPTLFSEKAALKVLYNCIISVIAVYFCVQIVYFNIFQGFLSLSMMGVGGDAVTQFSSQMFNSIKESALALILILAVIPASVALTVKKVIFFNKVSYKKILFCILACGISYILCIGSLFVGGTGVFSAYDTYFSKSSDTDIERCVQNFGILVTARLELQKMTVTKLGIEDLLGASKHKIMSLTHSSQEYSSDEYNVLDIDFEEIKKLAGDNTSVKEVLDVIEWRGATKKNEYTGMFEGYNLISICAESFSPAVIDKELTPTLYKLANEGFVFNNFYASFESVTTDGEFSFCLGMFPNLAMGKYNSSFKIVKNNALPYALGNMFTSVGANTYAYHNNEGSYYDRNISHPHMGYEVFRTPDTGLDVEPLWPASDLEMMQASVDDYISSGEQFHAYYMTFSGHYQYTWDNHMCKKNRAEVEHLDYSDTVNCYISSNLELEHALAYLMERLEEEGIADKTVIVLTTDHYPYGLSEEEFNELSGESVDPDFGKYKNSFICWNGGMKEPVQVDKLCSTVDILPTLLNLFGFEYDSRFVIGRDVLSDYEGIAMLSNQSFITEDYMFNAVDNETIMLTDKEISKKEIEDKKSLVVGTMGLSKSMLNIDIYKYLEEYLNNNK